jgi:hypothetical protein
MVHKMPNLRLLIRSINRNTLAGTRDKKIGGLAGNAFHFDVLAKLNNVFEGHQPTLRGLN